MRTQDEIEKKLEQLGTKRIELREKKSSVRQNNPNNIRAEELEFIGDDINAINTEINALKWCLGQSDIL